MLYLTNVGINVNRRTPTQEELKDIIDYWLKCPRGTSYLVEESLIKFLEIFTPSQIKGAMYLATSKGRTAYFKYLCGVLHNWKKDLEIGNEPRNFKITKD